MRLRLGSLATRMHYEAHVNSVVRAMLKISTEVLGEQVLLVLEGSLSGPWVAEAQAAWRRASINRQAERIRVDLSGVTFFSEEGRRLLEQICATGDEIISSNLLTKPLCEEFSKRYRRIGNR